MNLGCPKSRAWLRLTRQYRGPSGTKIHDATAGLSSGLNGVAVAQIQFGIIKDSQLLLDAQESAVTRSAFPSFSWCNGHSYIRWVIWPQWLHRLDYCNMLYVERPFKMVWKLQLMQNVAVHVIARGWQFESVESLLESGSIFWFQFKRDQGDI